MIVGDDNVVERRYIETGPLQADKTRVILEGLEAGEDTSPLACSGRAGSAQLPLNLPAAAVGRP